MGVRPRLRKRLSAVERELLERLFVELGPRLTAYLRHAYGLGGDAEDIVAETFCRAARNITALQGSNRQDLYLLTIARNLCRDRFRRGPGPRHDDRIHMQPDLNDGPPEAVSQGEQTDRLRGAVADLPDGLREIVVLRLSTGLKFEEIAELLQVPLGTALSRMHAAVERLKTAWTHVYER
jgi:RNA polymerase sigma-70 factor (ECF subfamily)